MSRATRMARHPAPDTLDALFDNAPSGPAYARLGPTLATAALSSLVAGLLAGITCLLVLRSFPLPHPSAVNATGSAVRSLHKLRAALSLAVVAIPVLLGITCGALGAALIAAASSRREHL